LTQALAERLPSFDKQQLLTLKTNAMKVQADAGQKADEAGALLPLIDAELARRGAEAAEKTRAKRKK